MSIQIILNSNLKEIFIYDVKMIITIIIIHDRIEFKLRIDG